MTDVMKPVVTVAGLDGNMANIAGICMRALRQVGLRAEADALWTAVRNAPSYNDALWLCQQAVTIEYSRRTVRNGVQGAQYIMKAGTYIVADPCHILDDRIYDNLLTIDGAFDGERPVCYGDNAMLWILPTVHGDGEYEGSDGKAYGVDSGTLAVIQVCATPTLFFKRGWDTFSQFTVAGDFTCERTSDGELVFGNFLTVYTDGTKCDECGDKYCDGCEYCGDCPQYCNCERDKEDDDE